MKESGLSRALSFAALALVGTGSSAGWDVDTSYLSYSESNERVSVSKALANLSRRTDQSTVTVSLVNDTMTGASPTGAIRSSDSAVTFTGASGVVADVGADYSKSNFDDHRKQAGFNYEHRHDEGLVMSYGGAVSRESDYDSYGVNINAAKTTNSKLTTYQFGLAYTQDTIYRSDTGGTFEPLSNIQSRRQYGEGERVSVEALLGITQVLNKRTVAQLNLTLSQSDGYHSDPYKIISAATDDERIMANFYDSRPEVRFRTSVFAKVVHQLRDSDNSLRASYRLYLDDWGINSHTLDFRYRHVLSSQQFLEPHIRFYTQSDADFYYRKLQVDEGRNPILPADGFASADYRLDSMNSATAGVSYGFSPTPATKLRLRAEYLDQRFSTADYSSMSAIILQASFGYAF